MAIESRKLKTQAYELIYSSGAIRFILILNEKLPIPFVLVALYWPCYLR